MPDEERIKALIRGDDRESVLINLLKEAYKDLNSGWWSARAIKRYLKEIGRWD